MSKLNVKIRKLFPGKRIVAFYIGHTGVVPDEWMVALGHELQKRGYGTVGLLSGDAAGVMNLDGLGHVFHIDQEEISKLDSIACFIMTDIEKFPVDTADFEHFLRYPQKSRVLAVVHSCSPCGDPQSFLQGVQNLGSFDGLIVGFPFVRCREKIKRLWDNFPPLSKQLRPATDFYLMGYGYPKLCLMRQKFLAQQQQQEAKSICYAPTYIDYAPYCGGNRVQKYGKRIIRALLAAFPDYSVIFRPAPMNRDEDAIQEIISYFFDDPRVIADTQTSYLDTFVKTQVMITDLAHIAKTFSVVTHGPSVYFQPWLKENGLHRNGLFYTTNSLSKLTLAVTHAMALSSVWADNDREKHIKTWSYIPFEHALEELANDLGDFIDRKPHPDWLVIRRDKDSPGASATKLITTILQEYEGLRLGHASEYARYFQSRALAVFAIHLHAQRAPELAIPLWLQRLAGLENCAENRLYGEVPPSEIAHLYREAAADLQMQPESHDNTPTFLRQLARAAEANISLQGEQPLLKLNTQTGCTHNAKS